MQGMSSIKLPLDMPSSENVSHESTDPLQRIHTFCQEWKEKRRHEWESLKVALEKMKVKKNTIFNKLKKKRCHICTNGTKPRKNKGYGKKLSQ